MNDTTSLNEALALVGQIRAERGWRAALASRYWGLAFRLTRVIEALAQPRPDKPRARPVLNFGCGNRTYANTINSDLFAPHRFIKGKKRPDLYWTGLRDLKGLHGHFEGIVCEHVIEHIHPDAVLEIFRNMRSLLSENGLIVVSFPDVQRVLASGNCQGFSSAIIAANSLIYRHGHCFMYDAPLVKELLLRAGFANVREEAFGNLPLQWALDAGRTGESSYVVASA
jgi:hypothetical protein